MQFIIEVDSVKTAEEIKRDISALPHREYIKLAHWFSERDWKLWDEEIERDAKSGNLHFLLDEALSESQSGKLRNL